MSKSAEKRYDFAKDLLKQEHTRWYQWAVFFTGSIASVFLASDQLGKDIAPWIPAGVSMLLSIMWTLAAIAIRCSTSAWWKTVQAIECEISSNADEEVLPSARHESIRDRWQLKSWVSGTPLLAILLRRVVSVSSMLILLGILSSLLFLALMVSHWSLESCWRYPLIIVGGIVVIVFFVFVLAALSQAPPPSNEDARDFVLSGTREQIRQELEQVKMWLGNVD